MPPSITPPATNLVPTQTSFSNPKAPQIQPNDAGRQQRKDSSLTKGLSVGMSSMMAPLLTLRSEQKDPSKYSPIIKSSPQKEQEGAKAEPTDRPSDLELSPAIQPKGHADRNTKAFMNAAGTVKGLFNIAWHEVFDPLVISAGRDFFPNGAQAIAALGVVYSIGKGGLQITSKQLFGEQLAKQLKDSNDKVKNMGANRSSDTKVSQSFAHLDAEEQRERAGQPLGEALSQPSPRTQR